MTILEQEISKKRRHKKNDKILGIITHGNVKTKKAKTRITASFWPFFNKFYCETQDFK